MRKIHVGLGGHPYTGDDVLFVQSATAEVFTQLLNAFVGDAVILSGCVVTITTVVTPNDTINWTAGVLYMNGEVFAVDSGSTSYLIDNAWEVIETNDPAGTTEYKDGNTVETYKIRKAKIGTTTGGSYAWTSFKKLKSWRNYAALAPLFSGNWATSGAAPQYGNTLIGEVMFRGIVTVASYASGTDSVIATLPAGFVPFANSRFLVAPAIVAGTRTILHIEINAAGQMKPLGLTNGQSVTLYLDGLRFKTED